MEAPKRETKAATAAGDATTAMQSRGKVTFKVVDPNGDFQGAIIVWRRIGASGTAENVQAYTHADLPLYKTIDDAAIDCYYWIEADTWTAGTGINLEMVTSVKGN